MDNRIIIDTIEEGGSGDEASVLVQSRNLFPGLGEEILTTQPAPIAMRQEHWPVLGTGHRLFLIHLILKKLDDYFCRIRRYRTPHIARPFGSVSDAEKKIEAYIYEWIFGEEGFPWTERWGDGSRDHIQLEEWNAFICAFNEAGIQVEGDVTLIDNGFISKNIIHQMPKLRNSRLNRFWMRIDFGPKSLYISYPHLQDFLLAHAGNLREHLSENRNESAARYDLLLLAHVYLTKPATLSGRDMGKLAILARDARLSQLKQYKARRI